MVVKLKRVFLSLLLIFGFSLTLFATLSIGPIMAPLSEVKAKQTQAQELMMELSRLYDIRAGEMETFLSRRRLTYPSEETRAQVKFNFADLTTANQSFLNTFDLREQLAIQWMSEQIQACLRTDCSREKWFPKWHQGWIRIERQLTEARVSYVRVGIEHRHLLRRLPRDLIELMGIRALPLFRMEFSHLRETLALDARGFPLTDALARPASKT